MVRACDISIVGAGFIFFSHLSAYGASNCVKSMNLAPVLAPTVRNGHAPLYHHLTVRQALDTTECLGVLYVVGWLWRYADPPGSSADKISAFF